MRTKVSLADLPEDVLLRVVLASPCPLRTAARLRGCSRRLRDSVDDGVLSGVLPPRRTPCPAAERIAWRSAPEVTTGAIPRFDGLTVTRLHEIGVVLAGAQVAAVLETEEEGKVLAFGLLHGSAGGELSWDPVCRFPAGNAFMDSAFVAFGSLVVAGCGYVAAVLPDARGNFSAASLWKVLPIEVPESVVIPDNPEVLSDDSAVYNGGRDAFARVAVVRDAAGQPVSARVTQALRRCDEGFSPCGVESDGYRPSVPHVPMKGDDDAEGDPSWVPNTPFPVFARPGDGIAGPSVSEAPAPEQYCRSNPSEPLPDSPFEHGVGWINSAVLAEHPRGSGRRVIIAARNREGGTCNAVLDVDTLAPLGLVPNTMFESEPGIGFHAPSGIVVQTVSYPSGVVAVTTGGEVKWAHASCDVVAYGAGIVVSKAWDGKSKQWLRLVRAEDGVVVTGFKAPADGSGCAYVCIHAEARRLILSSRGASLTVVQF